ncbi:MAG: hypothetical protein KDD44_13690, partial [Bdellovibrionales bacterium]|nr:hypothetical protein [Bdellovibrionales bacterium]
MKYLITFPLLSVVLITGVVLASNGSVFVDENDIFKTTASGTKYNCAHINGKYVPVLLDKQASNLVLPLSEKLKEIKNKLRSASSTKKIKIQKSLRNLAKKNKKGLVACKNGPNNNSKPSNSPTPTPRPIPNQTLCFDSNGDVSAAGKARFGVPSNMTANLNRG